MKYLEELNKMSIGQFLLYYRNLSSEDKINLIKSQEIIKLTDEKFNIVVLNSNEEEMKVLIDNEKLYDKLLNLPPQIKKRNVENIKEIVLDKPSVKRTILNILEENKPNILKLVIESPYATKYLYRVKEFISSLSEEKIDSLSKYINFDNVLGNLLDKEELKNYLRYKFYDVDESFDNVVELFLSKINKQINPILIFKLKNYKQFVMLAKFGLFADVEEHYDCIVLPSKSVIPYEYIVGIKDSYITKLIELLKQKGKAEAHIYLEVALKLYTVFGFDNAKKIIEDKFTKLNENSLARIVDFNFKDSRREFRTKNQDRFYFYGMENEIKKALLSKSDKIFSNLLFEPTLEKIDIIRKEFLLILYEYDGKPELNIKIKEKLCECINERERLYKLKTYGVIKQRVDNKISNFKPLDAKTLFKMLKDVDIGYVLEEHSFGMKDAIIAFLLGNTKFNNDCLFRLIVNDEALGLNDNLSVLINNFDLLNTVTYDNNLSINSVLDIINILKMDLYDLKPNEQDITLETLTRIINSTEYRVDYDLDYAKETCRLHVERKKKTFSTIPTVSGEVGEFKYFVAPFDAEYLLAAGNDGRNCFRIGALGQDFFEYCLKNKNAVIIYLVDGNGKKYVCPTIRSGNAINCNSIDPEFDESLAPSILKALSMCFKDIINSSYKANRSHEKNIEIATVSDLHLLDYFESSNIEPYIFERPVPLDCSCYSDYNKSTVNHYVLAKSKTYKKNSYYISSDEYYQKRDQDYEFDVTREYDKEKLSLIINSIYYSSIDYLDISTSERNERKRNFKKLDIETFKYITGNKDWFVAIDSNFNVISYLLPYDIRAKKDYFDALKKSPLILEQIMGESYAGKNL